MHTDTAFKLISPKPGSQDQRSMIHIRCSKCPSQTHIHQNRRVLLPDDAIRRMVSRKGWSLGHNRDRDICPSCNGITHKKELVMAHREIPVSQTPPTPPQHEPDDVDRQIFERLDQTNQEIVRLNQLVEDGRAAQELLMDQSSKLYETMIELLRENKKLQESVTIMAQFVLDDEYAPDDTVAPDVHSILNENEDIEPRIPYGKDGNTRRLTPVEEVTISDWDHTGIKLRFSRAVWNEAGMPIHEGAAVVVEERDGLIKVRAAQGDEKGIGIWRINEQSVHLRTKKFTTEKSDFHPNIREIHSGSIYVEME